MLPEDNAPQIKHRFVGLHGQGCSGKIIVINKVSTLVKSKGFLRLDCAQTILDASSFENYHTAHTLSGYPAIEDEDGNDSEEKPDCQRPELLLNTIISIFFVK